VRIDPQRAAGCTLSLTLHITDRQARHGWRVRNSVAAFVPDPGLDAPVEIESSFDSWLLFFTCRHTLDEFLATSRVVRGTLDQARHFFELFDYYDAADNHLIQPL
jgi:hypothetical protein